MFKKLIFLFIFIAIHNLSFSQERKKLITGSVKDSLGMIKDANIINLKTKQGTFSNEEGLFRIFVSKGDTLRFSSVQHEIQKIVVSENIFKENKIVAVLQSAIYTLDEIELKRHDLKGRLGIDIKEVPKDERDSLLRSVMDFSNIDFKERDNTIDDIKRAKPPIVNTMEGAMPMAGAGAAVSIPFQNSKKLWALRKELELKKNFPYKIMSELGDQFFFDELEIPIEKYFHFLEYCNPLGIENMYNKGRTLEVIKILKSESKSYLEIIKKE